ncbi:uncharacterized protein B0T15DRAFT_544381 [Chaetomium strumarium]|uniref:Rad60/SUMO-like domain-containing protein n=1 Tax=Chaetomium strumarium TaxID=1170767 RepID=A0AAJ0LXU5_9PEZI|nr:hypothetical protein B0T15DRAFT_544381 [Chaetomium strumarium]
MADHADHVHAAHDDTDPPTVPANHVRFRVRDAQLDTSTSGGQQTWFLAKRRQGMRKAMTLYCERWEMQLDSMRFLFRGRLIHPKDTAEMLGLQNDDTIEAIEASKVHLLLTRPRTRVRQDI